MVEAYSYFLSPAEAKEIFGVAVAQRVAHGSVGKANDPHGVAMLYVVGAFGFAGFAGNFGTVSGATVSGARVLPPGLNESSMNRADAVGYPDCPGCGYVNGATTSGGIKPVWPKTAQEMDDYLGFEGVRIPDSPATPGRNKVEWKMSNGLKITYEEHPYHPNAPDYHKGPHWHLESPGIRPHQRYLPGESIPGY